VQPVINELLSHGFSVQLRHVSKETSFQDEMEHGYVALFHGDTKLAHRDGFQHNCKLRNGGSWDGSAVAALVTELAAAIKVDKTVEAPAAAPTKA
jgi:hypothetical protein